MKKLTTVEFTLDAGEVREIVEAAVRRRFDIGDDAELRVLEINWGARVGTCVSEERAADPVVKEKAADPVASQGEGRRRSHGQKEKVAADPVAKRNYSEANVSCRRVRGLLVDKAAVSDFDDGLMVAFVWSGTPQGHKYWSDICERDMLTEEARGYLREMLDQAIDDQNG